MSASTGNTCWTTRAAGGRWDGHRDDGPMGEDDLLDGGSVLSGFRLSICKWFEEAGEREEE